VTGLFI